MLGCKVTRLAILAVFVLSAVLGAQEKPLRESGKAGATGDTKSKEAAGESKDAGNESSRPLESDQPAAETKSDQAPRRVAPAAPRDPFRPFTTSARASARRRENLTPLERYDLGQLKLVGIVWDVKEPNAMIEDSVGLGYIVKIGTPIGMNDGRVKAIRPGEVVVEETYTDIYGARKKRDVSMTLHVEKAQ